jgi:surfeit locus 1 family protein
MPACEKPRFLPLRSRRVLRQPRWIAGHVLVVILAATFVALGLWQLGRHDEKRDSIRAARAAYSAPAPSLTQTPQPAIDERYEVAGTFTGDDVALRNQVRGDRNGYDVLTPLRADDGSHVLVDRGWVAETEIEVPPAPSERVTVRGLAHGSRALDPDDVLRPIGSALSFPRIDLDRIAGHVNLALRDVWLEAQSLDPAPGAAGPALPQPPEPDRVNHLHYAIQWFSFAAIPLVGWPIVLRRLARRRAQPASAPDAGAAIDAAR